MNKRIIAALAAIVLAFAAVVVLLNYASGANDRAYNGAKLQSVLRVNEPIAANTKAADIAGKVTIIKLPTTAIAKGAIKNISEVAGLSTTTDLEPGEQVLLSRFAKSGTPEPSKSKSAIPLGMQELTISLDSARALAGSLKAGDTVGVVASYQTKEGDGVTQLIRNRVPVLGVGTGVADAAAAGAGGAQTITLAVFTRDAGKIINAIEFGKVWLTKQNAASLTGSGGSISRNDVTG